MHPLEDIFKDVRSFEHFKLLHIGMRSVTSESDVTDELPCKIVMFGEQQNSLHTWFDDLPQAWQAQNESEVDLVVCLREEKEVVEVCENPEKLERVQYQSELFIFTADAELLTRETIVGDMPPSCEAAINTNNTQLVGPKITYAQFEDPLRQIVEADEIEARPFGNFP